MNKFSKIQKGIKEKEPKHNVLYNNNYLKIIEYEDWSILQEKNVCVGIIYFIEQNKFLLRYEYIPTFKYVEGTEYYLTILSGGIEEGETPKDAFLREIEEEAGIIIDGNYSLEELKPLFINKGHTNKYFPFILTLTDNSFSENIPKGDGSIAEEKSKCVVLDVNKLDYIETSDLITDYMLLKFKEYLNK
jgi:8-oxo-dGTP pyrophosphatase MutT (NUDIX family)